MKKTCTTSCRFLIATIASLLIAAVTAKADDVVHYRARPIGSKVHIDGEANVHSWSMEGKIIAGTFDVPAGVTLDSAQAAVAGAAADGKIAAQGMVSIPVTSLLSGTQGMDQVMQDAMDAPNHPRIEYKLSEMTLKQPHTAGSPLQFDTKGELTINGVTKTISMPLSIETADKGKLKISANGVTINMTDYKVKPPVKFGIFSTMPDVKISFDWVVGVSSKAPAPPK